MVHVSHHEEVAMVRGEEAHLVRLGFRVGVRLGSGLGKGEVRRRHTSLHCAAEVSWIRVRLGSG